MGVSVVPHFTGLIPYVYRSCNHNLHLAYQVRINKPVREVAQGDKDDFRQFCLNYCSHFAKSREVSVEEYRLGKKASMQKRLDQGVEVLRLEGDKTSLKPACLVKAELRPALKNKPRLIVSTRPATVAMFGPDMQAMADTLHHFDSCFMHLSVHDMESALSEVYARCEARESSDLEQFDASFQNFHFRLACDIYILWGMPPALAEKLYNYNSKWRVSDHRSGFRFKVEGRRQSGSPETSVGNNLTAILAHLYRSFCHLRSLGLCTIDKPLDVHKYLLMMQVGDDNFTGWFKAAHKPKDLLALNKIGFNAKLGQDGEFLRCQFFEEEGRLVRNPIEVATRLPFCLSTVGNSLLYHLKYMHSKMQGYQILVGNDPLFWRYIPRVMMLLEKQIGYKPTYDIEKSEAMMVRYHCQNVLFNPIEPSLSLRRFVSDTFGISIAEQLRLETVFDNMSLVDDIYSPEMECLSYEDYGDSNLEPVGYDPHQVNYCY